MAEKRKISPQKKAGRKNASWRVRLLKVAFAGLLLFASALVLYVMYLDTLIQEKFDGRRWAVPAVVYARPLELHVGLPFSAAMLEEELFLAGYRREQAPTAPGGYALAGRTISLVSRDFVFADGLERSARISVEFSQGRVARLVRTDSGREIHLARLDPARIGSFHPQVHEDRILVSREDLPDILVKTLLAVEDQNFYSHAGVAPLAVLRALLANIRAGKTVQGGSTLTQQLVKNFFLDSRRTLWRKGNEAIMALLLERRYSKDEILTAYANEIFLGQDGGRAVHGFALAGQFYFRRELKDLSPAQVAILVGMIKGPSHYDPRRHPQRCLQRRQVVLDLMLAREVIDAGAHKRARASSLESGTAIRSAFNRYPAFLELVRRQLRQEYREEDLTGNGLRILTTLDPQVQARVEEQLAATLAVLEKRSGGKGLEAAVVVTSREGGEILALAGGRRGRESGFNRVLDARRPIGSLIKPAIYLAALAGGATLASELEDKAITVTNPGSPPWQPENYDRQEHGRVLLYQALARSYNLATVRLGMETGLDKVAATLRRLGVERDFPLYPSFLLGTAEMSPLEVTGMYQTLASGGFSQPQRAIDSVLDAGNTVSRRFEFSVQERFAAGDIYLLNTALQRAVSEGTGRALLAMLPGVQVAGKTGTSNDLRDSWFAGFSGDRLAVVWIGRDDNRPTGLSGASGALVAWGRIMATLQPKSLELVEPEGLVWARVADDTLLPFLAGTVPEETVGQGSLQERLEEGAGQLWQRLRGLFD